MKTIDSHQENIPIAIVGLNHKTANVDIREKATFSEDQQSSLILQLSKRFNIRGALVLSTCNRTEIYLCGRKVIKYISDLCTFLDKTKKENIFSNKETTYIYTGRKAIHHFFRVITSLDSQIVGEPQITGQVKDAYEKSRQLNHTDVLINKMFNFGMQVEKQVRTNTYLGDGAVSVSFAGVELARKIFGSLHNSTILLIGAGETAELAALNFVDREVSKILVANRTIKNARRIAKKVNGEALQLEDLAQAIEQADIIITAVSSDEFVLKKLNLEQIAKKRDFRSLFLIDLAIPRNIDPTVAEIDGIFLYNLDDLQDIVKSNIERRKNEIPKAEKIVENHLNEYIDWYNTLPVIKTITKLSQYLEEIRKQEFERLKNRFPKESLEEAEYLSKSLMKKFLHHHIISLRKSSNDPNRRKQHIDLVDEIYQLNGSELKNDKEN